MKSSPIKRILSTMLIIMLLSGLGSGIVIPHASAARSLKAGDIIGAELYDAEGSSPGIMADALAADGSSIGGLTEENLFIKYAGVDFGTGGFSTFMAMYRAPGGDLGGLQIWIDGADAAAGGTLVGTHALVASVITGADCFKSQFTGDLTGLAAVTGVHDVYLVNTVAIPDFRLDWFIFSTYKNYTNGYQEPAGERDARMQWWREARFGQFIHFGANAVLEGHYNGVTSDDSTWVQKNANIPRGEYQEVAAGVFNPTEWDADRVVAQAKAAGQRYIIVTTKHHEGFSMYDTNVREFKDYNLFTNGLYEGEDVVAGLARACKEQGLRFGTYYSVWDWYHTSQWTSAGMSQTGYGNNDMKSGYKDRYIEDMKAQLVELITRYDTDVLWFDDGTGSLSWWTSADGDEMYRFLRTIKPSLIINNRVDGRRPNNAADFFTPEGSIPATGSQYDFESCMTIGSSWGYRSDDLNLKSYATLLTNVVDSASKGGNYLLNIGPKPDGTTPESSIARLNQIGAWLSKYGEAIYGSDKGYTIDLPTGVRSTVKDGKIYLHINAAAWPSNGELIVPAPANTVTRGRVMGGDAISVRQGKSLLILENLPAGAPDSTMSVIELDVEGYPEEKPQPENLFSLAQNPASTYNGSNRYSSSYGYDKAFDGDLSTRWATQDNQATAWISANFGKNVTFNHISMREYFESSGPRVHGWNLQIWENSAWKSVLTGSSVGTSVDAYMRTPVTTDRIRVDFSSNPTGGGPTIYEIQGFLDDNAFVRLDSPLDNAVLLSRQGNMSGASNAEQIEVVVDGGAPAYVTPSATSLAWNYPLSGLSNGRHNVRIIARDDDGQIADMKSATFYLYDYSGYSDAVRGKTGSAVTQSSYWGTGYEGYRALDGSLLTRWAPETGDHEKTPWLQVDMGASTTFNTVFMAEMMDDRIAGAYRALGYEIQYSDSASGPWSTAYVGATVGPAREVAFTPVTGRYVRLQITDVNPEVSGMPNFYLFQVYHIARAVDKSALEAKFAEVDLIDRALYTPETHASLELAVSAAMLVFADDFATQSEVDAAVEAIDAAINALVRKPVREGVISSELLDPKASYVVGEALTIRVVTGADVTRVSLRNEIGLTIAAAGQSTGIDAKGNTVWDISVRFTSKGSRVIQVWTGGSMLLYTGSGFDVPVKIVEDLSQYAPAELYSAAITSGTSIYAGQEFTIQIKTSKGVKMPGLLNENGSVMGMTACAPAVDPQNPDQLIWTVKATFHTKGLHTVTVRVADYAGNWVAASGKMPIIVSAAPVMA